MSLIQTRSAGGFSATSEQPPEPTVPSTTVAPSETSVVDSVSINDAISVKWLVTITDTTNDRVAICEVQAANFDGLASINNYYAIAGDNIDYDIAVVIDGTDMNLEVQNNEIQDLLVSILREPVYSYESITMFVAAQTTKNIDAVSAIDTRSVKWFITVVDVVNEITGSCQVFAIQQGNATATHTRYSNISSIDFDTNVSIVGTDFVLQIENQSSDGLLVYLTKVTMPDTEVKTQYLLPNTSKIIKTTPVGTTRSVKWLVSAANIVNNDVGICEIFATHRNGANPTHVKYSSIGNLDFDIDVTIGSGNLQLEFVNNDDTTIVDVIQYVIPV